MCHPLAYIWARPGNSPFEGIHRRKWTNPCNPQKIFLFIKLISSGKKECEFNIEFLLQRNDSLLRLWFNLTAVTVLIGIIISGVAIYCFQERTTIGKFSLLYSTGNFRHLDFRHVQNKTEHFNDNFCLKNYRRCRSSLLPVQVVRVVDLFGAS